MIITDLILVHVLIVNLKRMGWQLLCFVQFPVKRKGEEDIERNVEMKYTYGQKKWFQEFN